MLSSFSLAAAKRSTKASCRLLSTIGTPVARKAAASVAQPLDDGDTAVHRLLKGRYPLDEHTYTPGGLRTLGAVLPNVDLREDFTEEDMEVLRQASHDAGGILVFPDREWSPVALCPPPSHFTPLFTIPSHFFVFLHFPPSISSLAALSHPYRLRGRHDSPRTRRVWKEAWRV